MLVTRGAGAKKKKELGIAEERKSWEKTTNTYTQNHGSRLATINALHPRRPQRGAVTHAKQQQRTSTTICILHLQSFA